MEMIKKSVVVDNIDIFYLDNENPNNKTVLFSHGWGGDKYNLAAIYNFLKKEFRVISIDLPGFGESQIDKTIDGTEKYAEVLYKFCKKINLDNIGYVGHSFGGKIGLILSANYPDLIEKLILIDSSGLKPKKSPIWYLKVYAFKALKFLHGLFTNDPDKIEAFKNKFGSVDYKNSGKLRSILVKTVNEDLTALIKKIKIPTFLYWGAKDKDTPLWMAKKINRLIPDSGLYVVKNGGHFSFLDDDRIISIIKSFFGE